MLRNNTLRRLATARPVGLVPSRQYTTPKDSSASKSSPKDDKAQGSQTAKAKDEVKMTQAQKDQELMRKLAGISGEGGEAGIEYEDGKPVAMKRGVKNNMFRLI